MMKFFATSKVAVTAGVYAYPEAPALVCIMIGMAIAGFTIVGIRRYMIPRTDAQQLA